jgi:hypothetical protein
MQVAAGSNERMHGHGWARSSLVIPAGFQVSVIANSSFLVRVRASANICVVKAAHARLSSPRGPGPLVGYLLEFVA